MQEPQAPFKSVTSLVVHFNSTGGITTGDMDMLPNNTIGSDQRTNKDMPEQVWSCPALIFRSLELGPTALVRPTMAHVHVDAQPDRRFVHGKAPHRPGYQLLWRTG